MHILIYFNHQDKNWLDWSHPSSPENCAIDLKKQKTIGDKPIAVVHRLLKYSKNV